MMIEIEVSSHQIYYRHVGEVVQWGHTVEGFGGAGYDVPYSYLQVPCVLLRVENRIEIVPLARAAYSYKINVLNQEIEHA